MTRPGQHFGAPYCYGGDVPDQEFGWGRSCSEFVPPVAKMGPHAAVLGMRFYTGNMFPPDYKDAIFVARHGSWNKTVKTGGDVVAVKLNKDGSVRSIEPFLDGFISDNNYLGRPVDVAMMKDGSLLVSDDWNGAIYRVTYGNAKRPMRADGEPARALGCGIRQIWRGPGGGAAEPPSQISRPVSRVLYGARTEPCA